MKIRRDDIDAMVPNSCQPERTTLLKTYPKVYPQKLRIISEVQALIKFKKLQNRLLFKQNYWQELSKPLIKKPTCFCVGFLLFFRVMKIF
jgi:hypothetical protein